MCSLAAKVARLLLFLINLCVWVCGAAILGVGITLAVDDSVIWDHINGATGGNMDSELYSAAVYITISVGALLFLIGFVGCCGVCKNSVCLLNMYIGLVSIMIILEITAAILAIVFKDSLDESIKSSMADSVQNNYNEDPNFSATLAWNYMQHDLECCGAHNYTDYATSVYRNTSENVVPPTCCKDTTINADNVPEFEESTFTECKAEAGGTRNDILYKMGCYDALWDEISNVSNIIIGVLIGLGVFQIAVIIFACCIRNDIQEDATV